MFNLDDRPIAEVKKLLAEAEAGNVDKSVLRQQLAAECRIRIRKETEKGRPQRASDARQALADASQELAWIAGDLRGEGAPDAQEELLSDPVALSNRLREVLAAMDEAGKAWRDLDRERSSEAHELMEATLRARARCVVID